MNQYYTGVALVLISAIGFGLMPIFALIVYHEGVNTLTLLFIRFAAAAALLLLYVRLRSAAAVVSRRQLGMLFVLGSLLYSLQSLLYFTSVAYISASLAVLLLYTYPIFVALITAVIDQNKPSGSNIIAVALSAAGLVLVLGAAPQAASPWGVGCALAAAVIYSAYVVMANKLVRQLSPVVASAFVALFAACSLLLGGLVTGSLNFALSLKVWLIIAAIVAVSTIIAMLSLFRGLELIGPTRTSILSMVEPLITFGFAALFFADRFTLTQLAGGAAVIAGAALIIRDN